LFCPGGLGLELLIPIDLPMGASQYLKEEKMKLVVVEKHLALAPPWFPRL
jgi:hypothetical protein